MFTAAELSIILTALDSEADFLRNAERHNIPTVRQLAMIAAMKAKVCDALEAVEKTASAAPSKESK